MVLPATSRILVTSYEKYISKTHCITFYIVLFNLFGYPVMGFNCKCCYWCDPTSLAKICNMYFLQAPNYPDSGRCWDIVDKYKVTIFYTAPTLVRSLMRDGNEARNFLHYVQMCNWHTNKWLLVEVIFVCIHDSHLIYLTKFCSLHKYCENCLP